MFTDNGLIIKLGQKAAACFGALSHEQKASLSEIRLRADSVSSFTFPYGSECMILDGQELILSASELEDIVFSLSGGSVYSHDESLRCGYFIYDKYRIGISGDFSHTPDGKERIKCIRSLNIRIPRFIPDAAYKAFPLFDIGLDTGLLVISPPNMGKTTFLKSAAAYISSNRCKRRKRVLIIDERYELYDKAEFSRCLADVISGLPKAKALSMGIRTLSPECAVLDEIGDDETADALFSASTGGVNIIASYHAKKPEEIYRKPMLKRLIGAGIFGYIYVFEDGGRILKTEEIP